MFTNFEIMFKPQQGVIKFFFLSRSITLKRRKELKHFIIKLIKREGYKVGTINYIFCSDDYLLGINRRYLSHDFYTDIITFQLSGESQTIDAEIYISVDRVKDNASNLGERISVELHRVVFHGALHLCGYKDKSKREIALMREKEALYLDEYL